MADLTDHNMERLSHLFASGNMGHAREIARLLNLERTEQCTKAGSLSTLLGDLLHGLHNHSQRADRMKAQPAKAGITCRKAKAVIRSPCTSSE